MNIEIHGGYFPNKGSEMMLRAAAFELAKRIPAASFAVSPHCGPYTSRCELKFKQIFPPRTLVGGGAFSKSFFRQKVLSLLRGDIIIKHVLGAPVSIYGCMDINSIDALIDISGFAFSDQWGTKRTTDFSKLTAYYRSKNIPIILLPQALGPFEKLENRTAFRKILNNATLVFARDRMSFEYVKQLDADIDNIFQAPDITLFYPDAAGDDEARNSEYVCLVPNIRMLDQGKDLWGDKYEYILIVLIRQLLLKGIKVYIVVHETSGQDLVLAKRLFKEASSPQVSIVTEENPESLKMLISKSMFLIGSRYHTLVAAFSKKVPAIALGWSHKYEMLFEEFGCKHLVINHDTPIETIIEMVNEIVDEEKNGFYRQDISERLKKMYLTNRKMWDQVTEALKSKIKL